MSAVRFVSPSDLGERPCAARPSALPPERLEPVSAWGMASRVLSYVYRPSTAEGIHEGLAGKGRLDLSRKGSHGGEILVRGGLPSP